MDKRSYRMSLGKTLKDIRKEKGLSAYKVSKNCGISIAQVKVIEDGETNYTIDTFFGYIAGVDMQISFNNKQ